MIIRFEKIRDFASLSNKYIDSNADQCKYILLDYRWGPCRGMSTLTFYLWLEENTLFKVTSSNVVSNGELFPGLVSVEIDEKDYLIEILKYDH